MPQLTSDESAALVRRFRAYLRNRRLPVTRQRDLIAELVFRSTEHPSAEAIERALAGAGVPVGTATVYRTLDLLVESGLARSHDFGEGFRRFEPVVAESRHGHLICTRCGQVAEFSNELLERMLPVIADEHEFRHAHHRVEIHGVCAQCRRRDAGGLR